MSRGWKLYAVKCLGVAGAYYGTAKLGLGLAFTTSSVTAIWPPTGIGLAALLIWGYRVWPGVAVGALLANSWTGVPWYTVVGITAGNTCEALIGAYLLRRFTDFRPSLARIRDVIALVALAAVFSTMVSATVGVLSLLAGGEITAADLPSVWRTWWLGDLGGDLVVATTILVAITQWPYKRAPGRAVEAVVLTVVILGVAVIGFSGHQGLTYLIFPPLVWAVLRFWQPGAALAGVLLAAIAVPLTANGIGPYSGNPPDERLLLAQTFVGVACLTALVLGAVVTERAGAERSLRESLAERERAEQRIRAQSEEIAELAEQRSQLVQQVVKAEDRTRREIGEALHDDALQTLLAVNHDLVEAAPGRAGVIRAQARLRSALTRLRMAVHALHPVALRQGDLAITLSAIAGEQAERGVFRHLVRVAPEAVGYQDAVVLSIARELLTNVATHARASQCSATVDLDDGWIEVQVTDDGRGMPGHRPDEALREGHVGLALTAQRVEALGGELKISSMPGEGTTVRASFPITAREPVAQPG